MNVEEAIRTRRSTRHYDTTRPVERHQIEELIELANLAPSSFNLQHWKFIVVDDDPEWKQKLHALALRQQQILDAAATLIVIADPGVYLEAETHFDEWPLDKSTKDKYVGMAMKLYDPSTSRAARDEALRSVGLWATTFMLAAWDRGLATGPMIGFNAAGVAKAFDIQEPMFPAMLITVGYPGTAPGPRFSRRPISEVLRWNEGRF